MLIENWRPNKKSWTILGVTLKSCNSCRHSALHDGGVYLLYSYTAHYTAIAPSGLWNLQYVNMRPSILIKSFSKVKNEFYPICPNHMNMHHYITPLHYTIHLESPAFIAAHVHSNQVIFKSETRVSSYLSESHEHAHIILAYVDLAWLFWQRNSS